MDHVDPEIVKHISVPMGPHCHGYDLPSLKWEYVIIIDHRLKQLEALAQSSHLPHELHSLYNNFRRDFQIPIGYINYQTTNFQGFVKKVLPERLTSNLSTNIDIIQGIRDALKKDVEALGAVPEHFTSAHLYVDYHSLKMAKEMEMTQFDGLKDLKDLHASYIRNKRAFGDDSEKDEAHHYAVDQLKRDTRYQEMTKHMTLVHRMQELEARVKQLEELLH